MLDSKLTTHQCGNTEASVSKASCESSHPTNAFSAALLPASLLKRHPVSRDLCPKHENLPRSRIQQYGQLDGTLPLTLEFGKHMADAVTLPVSACLATFWIDPLDSFESP